MKQLLSMVKGIAQRINAAEKNRKLLAEFIRNNELSNQLIHRQAQETLKDIKIVGIDGGVVKKSLHEFDCVLTRAVGVCFHYQNSKAVNVNCFPSRFPPPNPYIFETISDLDLNYAISILRQQTEIKTALQSLEKFRPDIILLDGLIVPHYSDKPSKSSHIYEEYFRLIDLHKDLYKKCEENGALLAGVIEDSRNTIFCDMLKEEKSIPQEFFSVLNSTRDTNLLFTMLKKGERTKYFRYSASAESHPVVKDMEDFASHMYSFYLKTAEWDRPIKVDTLTKNPESDIERLASILLSISGQHSRYGLPIPLIEADNVAKLSETDMDNFYNQILTHAGNLPGLMRLRREQRPF